MQIAKVLGVTVEYLVTGADSKIKSPASNINGIDSEIEQLLKSLKNLSKAKQRIVIKNAINLCEIQKKDN